jgi:hypothetical protein
MYRLTERKKLDSEPSTSECEMNVKSKLNRIVVNQNDCANEAMYSRRKFWGLKMCPKEYLARS